MCRLILFFQEGAARAICDAIKASELEFDYIVGVPYGAIMIATVYLSLLNKVELFNVFYFLVGFKLSSKTNAFKKERGKILWTKKIN